MIKEGIIISSRYEIVGRIGTGGMADVYKAVDRVLNRYVAVKVLKREFREDENFVKKFRSEAQAAAGLQHANIVNVYDVAEDRGLYYIVMELVEGITLKDYIQKKGRLNAKEVIGITLQVCAGIEAAHSKNIIHRDIKPQNIIISKEGKVKVTDFGIAKATSSNTISTNAMGSVHYTSPEQARGGFSDAKSDIYSLGITMYEMITGVLPFDGDSTVSIALKHLQEDITVPSEVVPDIPYSLEQIILKCTQKSPDRRYADVTQLMRDMKRSIQEPDGDFVRISPLVSVADTVMISPEELERIQEGAEYDSDYDDDYDDEDRKENTKSSKKKEGLDPKMAKIMKILTIVVAAIFALILVFSLGVKNGWFKFGPGVKEESEKYIVPNIVGKSWDEAEKLCREAGLQIEEDKRELSKKYEEDYIIKQKTQAGAAVQEGFILHVNVSSGLLLEIPDVSDMDYIYARDRLIDKGFTKSKIKIEEEPSSDIDEDKVTRTDPEAGEWQTKDTVITIYVSTGVEMVEVPKLVGKTKEEAEKALTDAKLVGSVTEEYSPTVAAGIVISQFEDAGDKVEIDTTISYVVSKGEEPKEQVEIPTGLVGKHISVVEAKLKNQGFDVNITYEPSSEQAKNYVVFVEGEGLSVDKGSTVTVVVSTGSENSDEGNNQDDATENQSGNTTGTSTGTVRP